jgi:predicted secreted Zn-dependent protease
MTDTHLVSALKEKRMRVASQIEVLQEQIQQTTIDFDHVESRYGCSTQKLIWLRGAGG